MRHYDIFDPNDIIPDEFVAWAGAYPVTDFIRKNFSFLYSYFMSPDFLQGMVQKHCKTHNINIKLLLAAIEHSSGFITMKTPPQDVNKAMNWVLQMGGNQPSSTTFGFEGQISKYAALFRELMDKAVQQVGYELKVDDGEQVVLPANRASCVLYRLYPWVGNVDRGEHKAPHGNFLFWQTWQKLFPEDFTY